MIYPVCELLPEGRYILRGRERIYIVYIYILEGVGTAPRSWRGWQGFGRCRCLCRLQWLSHRGEGIRTAITTFSVAPLRPRVICIVQARECFHPLPSRTPLHGAKPFSHVRNEKQAIATSPILHTVVASRARRTSGERGIVRCALPPRSGIHPIESYIRLVVLKCSFMFKSGSLCNSEKHTSIPGVFPV